MYLAPFNVQSIFTYHLARKKGMNIDAFLDNDAGKHGKDYAGIPIAQPELKTLDKSRSIMICSIRSIDALQNQFTKLGWTHITNCYSLWDEDKEYKTLSIVKAEELENKFPDIYENYQKGDYELRKTHLPPNARNSNAFILSHFNMRITTRCNFKCKNCTALVQYNNAPRHFSPLKLKNSLNNLMNVVDFIGAFSLLGGEPLLRRDLPALIEIAIEHKEKIGALQITTNGSIIPNKNIIEMAKNHNIVFAISNYGKINSQRILDITTLLKKHGIKYFCYTFPFGWRDIGRIIDGGSRTQEDIESMYCNCNLTAVNMMEDALCKCDFIAAATDLRAVPFDKKNTINLTGTNLSRKEIKSYINSAKPYPACAYCLGDGMYNTVRIPVAEQIDSVLEYTQYKYQEDSAENI